MPKNRMKIETGGDNTSFYNYQQYFNEHISNI